MKLIATVNTEIFANIVNVLSACGGEAVLYFSETALSLCIPQGLNQISLWISCSVQLCFAKYLVVSKNSNTITLKCNAQQLAQALTTEAPLLNMSLARFGEGTILQFEHRSTDTTKQLMQRVGVSLLSQRAVDAYQEPVWGPATISTKFPPIKSVNNWINEMKEINNLVLITATKEGDVLLKVDSDTVTVETRFKGLEIPGTTEHSLSDEAEAFVDIKKLRKILRVGNLQGATGELHIYDKSQARMFFTIPSSIPDQPTNITYVLNATTKAV